MEASKSSSIHKHSENCHRFTFFWVAAISQIVIAILFGIFADYGDGSKPSAYAVKTQKTDMDHFYPLYQDVHVMIFIGFGFLMTFLSKYGFSAVGYNFLIAAFTIQWGILMNGFMHGLFHTDKDGVADPFHANCPNPGAIIRNETDITRWCIKLNIETLIKGDFAAGAVLITFGAVLGKTTPAQMLIVALVEIVFYALNENIGAGIFSAVDMGGSIFVHTFGAYFGLGLSYVISSSKNGDKCAGGEVQPHAKNKSNYHSDMFAMIGTLFLWMFWPSFNGALATDDQQQRVVINTVLALAACCVTAFCFDNLLRKHHKFDMVSIQNATLAGGVAVGSSSDLVIQPWGAILIGMAAGFLSVMGYVYIQPALENFGLDDTCGVHNLHGLPGILGAVGGAISAALAGSTVYGESIGTVFPARADDARTAGEQAGFQLAALAVTLVFSLSGGFITGMIIKAPFMLYKGRVKGDKRAAVGTGWCNLCHGNDRRIWYDDSYYWEVPGEHEVDDGQTSVFSSCAKPKTEKDAAGDVELTDIREAGEATHTAGPDETGSSTPQVTESL